MEKRKSVYELKEKEGLVLQDEFMKTSYGKNIFWLSFLAVFIPIFLACIGMVERVVDHLVSDADLVFSKVDEVMIIFGLVLWCLLRISWMNQLKKFYESKK